MVDAVGKIFAFQPQGPVFNSWLCRDLNICVIFFSVIGDLAFHLFKVGKNIASLRWISVPCKGRNNRSMHVPLGFVKDYNSEWISGSKNGSII